MPKLYHKKSRQGCSRCRQRRVKCDETRPKCGACMRHGVSCEYPVAGSSSASIASQNDSASPAGSHSISNVTDASPRSQPSEGHVYAGQASDYGKSTGSPIATASPLELRLFQYFLVHTSSSFSIAHDYWRMRVASLASEYRAVLDGILALAALHLYRQTTTESPIGDAHRLTEPPIDNALFMAGATSVDMLRNSVHYLSRVMSGHRELFQHANKHNFEAVYLSSVMITLVTAFMLSADDNIEDAVEPFDEIMWMRLGSAPRLLVPLWNDLIDGVDPLVLTGAYADGPDFSDNEALFDIVNGKRFEVLLTWASDFEYLNSEDHDAYEKTVSYIGGIHKAIGESENPQITNRRLIAFPSRVPRRFVDLALSQQPRALVVIGHVFALMKLLARGMPWVTGIAEKHLPRIEAKVPPGWRPLMRWPLAVLACHGVEGEDVPYPPSKEDFA